MADKKMFIKLKENASDLARTYGYPDHFYKLLKEYDGKWVEVDTNSLFWTSFNAKIVSDAYKNRPEVGCTHIDAKFVDAVQNDARIGRKRCEYCGKHSIYKDKAGRLHKTCPYCKRTTNIYVFNHTSNTNGIVC